jgi:hypothetical protein
MIRKKMHEDRIIVDQEIAYGKPVIKDFRKPVEIVLGSSRAKISMAVMAQSRDRSRLGRSAPYECKGACRRAHGRRGGCKKQALKVLGFYTFCSEMMSGHL